MPLIDDNFNPRPPRGGRPQLIGLKNYLEKISIHALREEGDPNGMVLLNKDTGFQSTPSARRATQLAHLLKTDLGISIHALREEGDKRCNFQVSVI